MFSQKKQHCKWGSGGEYMDACSDADYFADEKVVTAFKSAMELLQAD
jgi:hypothetical protein